MLLISTHVLKNLFGDYMSVVIYSGGMDSFTLLNRVIRDEGVDNVVALSFDYGQRHVKELSLAKGVCFDLKVKHHVILLPALRGSALTDDVAVPEGHYADENMKQTVVPNRNMVMLSIAASYTIANKHDVVYYGAHAGDHAIYPDCRREFIEAVTNAICIGNYSPCQIVAPYVDLSKGSILAEGLNMGLDYSLTWTCYNGREKACGKCGSCVERLEAFDYCLANDPLEYEND